MAKDIIDTLHPEGSLSDNFYPNIKTANIPDGAITNNKIADGAITNNKIADGTISYDKIPDNEITVGKLDPSVFETFVTVEDKQTIVGQKTFTAHIKNDEIDNTNGNAMLRYKSAENKVVLGGSTIPTTIMGSDDRPTYSKDGSDFSGDPLVLYSDNKLTIPSSDVWDYVDEIWLNPEFFDTTKQICIGQIANNYKWSAGGYTSFMLAYTDAPTTWITNTTLGQTNDNTKDMAVYKTNRVYEIYQYGSLHTAKTLYGYIIFKKLPNTSRVYPGKNLTINANLAFDINNCPKISRYLLRRKLQNKNDTFFSFAHQGYWHNSNLNSTKTAIVNALQKGANALEMDLVFTSDNECVICHDNTFSLPTGETYNITEHTLAECKEQDFKVVGEKIQTLEEVLIIAKYYNAWVAIDHLSNINSDEKFKNVSNTITKVGMWKHIILNVPSSSVISMFNTIDNTLPINFDDDGNGNDIYITYLSTRKFVNINVYRGSYNGSVNTIDDKIDYLMEVKAKGFGINLWPINFISEYARYSKWATGITGDRYYLQDAIDYENDEGTTYDEGVIS